MNEILDYPIGEWAHRHPFTSIWIAVGAIVLLFWAVRRFTR